MKRLVVLLVLLLIGTDVEAKARFVSTLGDSAAGDSVGTIGSPISPKKALQYAAPGDSIYWADGEYARFPLPVNFGGSDSTTGRIIMIGNTSDRTLVSFPGGRFRQPYISWEYMMFTGSSKVWQTGNITPCYTSDPADTVNKIVGSQWKNVKFRGSLEIAGIELCKFINTDLDTIIGAGVNTFHFSNIIGDSTGGCGFRNRLNIFDNVTINLSTQTAEPVNVTHMFEIGGDSDIAPINWVRENIFKNCTINATNSASASGPGEPRGVYLMTGLYNSFENNLWNMSDYSPASYGTGNRVQYWRIRDAFNHNKFYKDTFVIRGRVPGFMITSQGSQNKQTGIVEGFDNDFSYCTFDWQAESGTFANGRDWDGVEFTYGIWGNDFDHCIFKSNKRCAIARSIRDLGGSFKNCTFYPGVGYTSIDLLLDDNSSSWDISGAINLSNNIYYANSTSPAAVSLMWAPGRSFTSNNNLYWHPTGPGKSIRYKVCDTGFGSNCSSHPYIFSDPGTVPQANWYSTTAQDAQSRHGSPAFKDSVFATLNPRLTYKSIALFSDSGFVGAIPYYNLYTLYAGDSLGSSINYEMMRFDSTNTTLATPCNTEDLSQGLIGGNKAIEIGFGFQVPSTCLEKWEITIVPSDTIGKSIDAIKYSLYAAIDEYFTPGVIHNFIGSNLVYGNIVSSIGGLSENAGLTTSFNWINSSYVPEHVKYGETPTPWFWAHLTTDDDANTVNLTNMRAAWQVDGATLDPVIKSFIRLNCYAMKMLVYGSPW